MIRSGATEFRYQREDQPLPKIGRWREMLDRLLSQNEANSSRERLTLIRLFEELREHGYDGGYDAVRRYARSWAQERRQATAAAALAPSPRAASQDPKGGSTRRASPSEGTSPRLPHLLPAPSCTRLPRQSRLSKA